MSVRLRELSDSYERRSDLNKKLLLERARTGKSRPSQLEKDPFERRLGIGLTNYTKGNAHDPEFTRQIRALRPEWLKKRWSVHEKITNQKKLLNLAKTGKDKPLTTTRLGNRLSNYISKRDSEFCEKLLEIRPDWFVKPSDLVMERKIYIIQMVQAGEPRPRLSSENCYEREWARYLGYYMQDYEFRKLLQQIPSDWFIPEMTKKKVLLLQMARMGYDSPPYDSPLGKYLARYRRKDPLFRDLIFDIRPDWFSDLIWDRYIKSFSHS